MPYQRGISYGAAVCGSAQAVESQIVGYTSTSIEAGRYYLVATQFKDTGKTAETITLDKLIQLSNIEAATFQQSAQGNGVQIQVLKDSGSGYTTYYYVSNPSDATGPCWVASNNKAATQEFALGTGFWFKTASAGDDASARFAGEVKGDANTKILDLRAGYNMICNPFPVALTGNLITVGGIEATTFQVAAQGNGVQIQILKSTGSGYTTYYYVSNPSDATGPCWVASNNKKMTNAMAGIGEAFWLKTPEAGTLTFELNSSN